MTDHPTSGCAFDTDRLTVGPWHELADRYGIDLGGSIRSILTVTTTSALPPDWQGDFDDRRAQEWLTSRDAESPTLLVVERTSGRAVGLVVLFETSVGRDRADRVDVRLGYVLAESAWGYGYATELVGGLMDWAREHGGIDSITGGVAVGNDASANVLLKNGFVPTTAHADEQMYRYSFR